uniref:Uncharacterized protein n=1 Tax=Triticum urartu TaxID=4572 RepID=A0A8R7V2T2_TRIUA
MFYYVFAGFLLLLCIFDLLVLTVLNGACRSMDIVRIVTFLQYIIFISHVSQGDKREMEKLL